MANATDLSRACAPLFLFLTSFRRNASTSRATIQELQSTLRRELDKVAATCARDPRLAAQFERARYALVATADQVILGSAWTQRAGWAMSLLEQQVFGRAEGGREFYKVADQVLHDPSEDAVPVAEVLFECMALGFQGQLIGERKELEQRRRQLFEKARLAGALGKELTPAAYGRNAEGKGIKLPAVGTLRMVGVAVASLIFYFVLGRTVSAKVTEGDRTAIQDLLEALERAPQAGEQAR